MERLTRRMCRSWSVIPGYELSTVKGMQAVVDRLAAYEDTGLEPEEVVQTKLALMGKVLAEIKEFDGFPVNRMIELAQAEKDGRLVVLPCKKRLNERHICGTCFWYDYFEDICRNPATPHERNNVKWGMGCSKWKKEF